MLLLLPPHFGVESSLARESGAQTPLQESRDDENVTAQAAWLHTGGALGRRRGHCDPARRVGIRPRRHRSQVLLHDHHVGRHLVHPGVRVEEVGLPPLG